MKNITPLCLLFVALASALGAASNANTGANLGRITREADSVVVEYFAKPKHTKVAFSDPAWIERLAKVLESGSYEPRSHCMCISFPMISIYRKGELVGTFSVHHGEKLRAYAGNVNGDFFVGPDLGAKVNALANENKANKTSEPTAMTRPPPATIPAPLAYL